MASYGESVDRLLGELAKLPGVGKKTAERLVLELKDKIAAPSLSPTQVGPRGAEVTPRTPGTKGELLHGTLTRMGFRPSEAERAILALGPRVDEGELGDLVREALALLSK